MAVRRLLVIVLAVLSLGGVEGGQQMVEGHVGCRFSNSICSEDEECVNDGLFGNCQKIVLPKDTHTYKLTSEQLQELEGILQLLIESGYTWRHKFTQCVLLSTLLAYRYHFQLNLKYCDPEGVGLFPYPAEVYPSFVPQSRAGLDRRGYSYSGYHDGRNWEKQDGYDAMERYPGNGNDNYNDATYQKRFYGRGGGVEREEPDAGGVDDFLNNLSSDELNDLKEFLVKEENADGMQRRSSPIGRPVKKSSAMQTNVVVHFTPGESEDSDAEAENAAANDNQPESTQSNADTAEQMMADGLNRQNSQQQQPTASKENPAEKAQKAEYLGQYRTGLSQNPMPVVIPGAGSQMGLTTIIPSALAKDNTLIKLEPVEVPRMATGSRTRHYLITMYVLCGVVGVIIAAALAVYVMRRHAHLKDKIAKWAGGKGVDETTNEYQDLCRQHMQAKLTEKTEPVPKSGRVEMISAAEQAGRTTSTGSSTSSWTEEPVASSMDISTGHIILSYMEDHLTNKDRLQKEWDSLCAYDAEPCSIVAAIEPTNMRKNRYTDILPYEHSRVKLNPGCNVSGSDYINACSITDHDPRNPAYIAAQGPLPHTVADFWQMVWEQGSVVIVNLTRLMENTISVCHRYWPEEGSDLYHIYEVHLVSEHAWCDDYVVRSFFLKNLQTNETRTITQFHFLTWPNLGIPSSTKTLLDFRRKVNKSFRGRSCPIVVHCSDGAGRTGTYCLIDMALNRLHKGAKEIDIAATLEHIRDQRVNMVRTKEQFEFALAAVAEEVHAIVHVPPTQ